MYTKLSIALTSTMAMMATAHPYGAATNSIKPSTNEARDRSNFRVCGSRATPSALFSLTDQVPLLRGSRSSNRILLRPQGDRAIDGITLAVFEPLIGATGCQLNFVLPQPRTVNTNFAGQAQGNDNANNKLVFTNKVRVDVIEVARPGAVDSETYKPSWYNLMAQGVPVFGQFNLAQPGVQVVNVVDCSKDSAFLMRISGDSQTKNFVFDQRQQVGDDQSSSLGLFMSFNC